MMAVPYPVGWIPQGMADLLWWIDASRASSITKDGSNLVSAWNDLSGSGFNLAQGTSADRPLWVSAAINGLPAIEFTDERMLGSFAHTGGSAALFAVGTLINGGSNSGRMIAFAPTGVNDAGADAWQALKRSATSEQINASYNGTAYGASAVTYTVPFLRTSMIDGTNGYTGLNGSTVSSDSAVGTSDFDRVVVGANVTIGGAGTTVMHGRVAEVVMLSARPSLRVQQLVEGYLAWKWGIALASGHPWRTRAP